MAMLYIEQANRAALSRGAIDKLQKQHRRKTPSLQVIEGGERK